MRTSFVYLALLCVVGNAQPNPNQPEGIIKLRKILSSMDLMLKVIPTPSTTSLKITGYRTYVINAIRSYDLAKACGEEVGYINSLNKILRPYNNLERDFDEIVDASVDIVASAEALFVCVKPNGTREQDAVQSLGCATWATQSFKNDPNRGAKFFCKDDVVLGPQLSDAGLNVCFDHAINVQTTNTIPVAQKPSGYGCFSRCTVRADDLCYLPVGRTAARDEELAEPCGRWARTKFRESGNGRREFCSEHRQPNEEALKACRAHNDNVQVNVPEAVRPTRRSCATACLSTFEAYCQ